MAKVTGGTDGSISGAIGAVVFYRMRGKSFIPAPPRYKRGGFGLEFATHLIDHQTI